MFLVLIFIFLSLHLYHKNVKNKEKEMRKKLFKICKLIDTKEKLVGAITLRSIC